MDQFLADYYGTNAAAQADTEDELEKMAQLVMLDKLAQDEGADLSHLTEEQALELAGEIFGGGEAQAAPEGFEKEAQAKFEEADFLGRVMAHSMWNELESIQKTAYDSTKAGEEVTGGKVRQGLRRAGQAVSGAARTAGGHIARHKGKYIGGTAGAAALTAGGILGAKALKKRKEEKEEGKGKSKKSSAFDSIADARAYEILQANGLADEYGNIVTPDELYGSEKTAADEFGEAVEYAAMERLAEMGYRFDE